jgi:hypothetical protein
VCVCVCVLDFFICDVYLIDLFRFNNK